MQPSNTIQKFNSKFTLEGDYNVLINESECHILKFSEKAIYLKQSVNYMVGEDIYLHIVVELDHSAIVINDCMDGIWREQSSIHIPKAEDLSLQIAILFRNTQVDVAVLGSNMSRTITRNANLVSVPVQVSGSEYIELQRVVAPARLPAGSAALDFFGLFPDGATVLCGWIAQPWSEMENLTVVLIINSVKLRED